MVNYTGDIKNNRDENYKKKLPHYNIKLIYDIISLLVKKLIKRMYIQPNTVNQIK